MSLRHAVLGLLARRPSTGYELTQSFDHSLKASWHANHSQIYPELAKLEAADLAEVVGHGPRRSKTYAITPAGRVELRRWLVETQPDRSQRSESGLRLFLTPLLDPIDRHTAYRRDLTQVEAELAELEELRTEAQGAVGPQVFAPQIELGIRVNNILRDWLHEQIEATTDDNRGPGGADK